jgi:hypothetical protein
METKKYRRLPYGNSDFRSIRMENYAYVDKTRYIELLERESNKNQFFIRPRKFGKSLFFTTLMGFTQAEVEGLMKETGVNPEFINVDMEAYYNGYLFHKDGKHRVYNPAMILIKFSLITIKCR